MISLVGREVWLADVPGPSQMQTPLIACFPMVNPSFGSQKIPEQRSRTTEEVDVVQIWAKYKAARPTLGVRPRLVGASLGGEFQQHSRMCPHLFCFPVLTSW